MYIFVIKCALTRDVYSCYCLFICINFCSDIDFSEPCHCILYYCKLHSVSDLLSHDNTQSCKYGTVNDIKGHYTRFLFLVGPDCDASQQPSCPAFSTWSLTAGTCLLHASVFSSFCSCSSSPIQSCPRKSLPSTTTYLIPEELTGTPGMYAYVPSGHDWLLLQVVLWSY